MCCAMPSGHASAGRCDSFTGLTDYGIMCSTVCKICPSSIWLIVFCNNPLLKPGSYPDCGMTGACSSPGHLAPGS